MTFDSEQIMTDNLKKLERASLSLTPQPGHEAPEFPSEVSELQPLEISNLMVEYTAWYAYSASVEAYLAAEANIIKGQLDYLAASLYITAPAKTIEDRKMAKYTDKEYVKESQHYLNVSAQHEIVKSLTSKYDKYLWTLSRYLTTLQTDKGIYT